MFTRNHVIHLVRLGPVILMQKAVLAAIPGALNHQSAKAIWNTGAGHKVEGRVKAVVFRYEREP